VLAATTEAPIAPIPKFPPINRSIPLVDVTLSDIVKHVQSIREQRRGVGLFRRLSLVYSVEMDAVDGLSRRMLNGRTELTPELDASLFGLRRSADPSSPGYDELGAFPMFTDSKGYEYFFTGPNSGTAHVRIPRRIIGHANRVRHTVNELPAEPVLPDIGTPVELRMTRPVVCPIYFDKRTGALAGIRHSGIVLGKVEAFMDRYTDLSSVPLHAVVTQYEQRTEAVAQISIKTSAAFASIIAEVCAWRVWYSARVAELITDLFDANFSHKDILSVSEYLQHVWVDKTSMN
jgi:hypothetical protein